jgi:hypothetical protein
MIRLDGRAGKGGVCYLCKAAEPAFRCEECFGGEMYCQGCMVDVHATMPLHRIEVNTRSFGLLNMGAHTSLCSNGQARSSLPNH